MHGRRSIIKRRDDDDITMTRPLNKRVSFSANNYTRLFQVDSDESTRQTNLDSTGHQSTMSLMEQTMSHTMTVSEFNQSHSTGAMDTTHIDDLADDADGAGFDWMDENMEVDQNVTAEETQAEDPTKCGKEQPASNQASIDIDDKTRPVELQTERTDIVKNEILRVASKLLKPGGSSDETKSPLDIYGIKAALSSQTVRQEKSEHTTELDISLRPVVRYTVPFNEVFETTSAANQSSSFSQGGLEATQEQPRPSLNPYTEASPSASCEINALVDVRDVPMYDETGNLEDEESSMLQGETSLDESRCLSSQETARGQSESWFECTGVKNFDQEDESSMKFSERALSPEDCSNQSSCTENASHRSEAEMIGDEEAEFEVSRLSNRLASSRDSMARPRARIAAEERQAFENVDESSTETSSAPPKANRLKTRRPTIADFTNESSNSDGENDYATLKPQTLPKQLSPCLEESSGISSLRVEQRTSDVSSTNSELAPSTRRTFDILPDDCHSKRRTFDVLPVDSSTVHSTRRTFDVSATNETYSVHHNNQDSKMQDTTANDASNLADEPVPNLPYDCTLPLLHRSTRSLILTDSVPEENWTLEDWIKHDAELFSVFAEPLPEVEPVPVFEDTGKQIIELDEERLWKTLNLEPDPEFEYFLQTQRETMRRIVEETRRIRARVEAQLDLEMRVFIDNSPFYRELSPEKFKISVDRRAKTVTVSYRVSSPVALFPCMTIECKEKNDGTVACSAKAVELPAPVCSFSPYINIWIENALNGRNNFTAKTWKETQDKVLSALKVMDVHFNAFESVKYRLHWCEQRGQVYLNMLWRDRVVRAYVDADLREELVPQDATTALSFRGNDLHAAWKSDGISDYLERINKVHRRNLEIAAEETIQSAKF